MRRLVLAALLALAACGRPEVAPEPTVVSFRDAGVPLGSTTRGTVSDIAGDWVIAQSFPGSAWAAPGTRLQVQQGSAGAVLIRYDLAEGPLFSRLTEAGPGRLRAEDGTEFWVLWVDDGFRTAVLGTPSGQFGWIMDRPGAASADRTAAAREVLDFNGYDVTRLVP